MRLRMTLDRIGMALGDAPPPPPHPAPAVLDTVDAQFMEAMQVHPDQWAANCACARQTKTNEFWRIWAKPNEPGKPGKSGHKTGIFRQKRGKTGKTDNTKTGHFKAKTGQNGQHRVKNGRSKPKTKSFAEFWFGITTP